MVYECEYEVRRVVVIDCRFSLSWVVDICLN